MRNKDTFNSINMGKRLVKRGVLLNRGLSDREIAKFIYILGFAADENVISMYKEFNGFGDGESDGGSGFNIWPIERVLEENKVALASAQSRMSFADFLIDSNNLTCDFRSADSAIRYLDDPEDVADSFVSFCSKLVEGAYDF